MNRADLLYSVLKDGEPHTRRDIQRRVGYFLTNNAASELRRRRGISVTYAKGRYQLVALSTASPGDSSSGGAEWSEPGDDGNPSLQGSSTSTPHVGADAADTLAPTAPTQMTIEEAA